MAAKVEFPFTSAQWKELERQAMIYKYMMESIPVPAHLLSPSTTNFAADTITNNDGLIYNLRYTNNNKDSEPGRCKRTDGKKWRCSRDVAPNHKYCERHMHRGRPRSRKPVEVDDPLSSNNNNNNSNKKSRLNNSPLQTAAATAQPNNKSSPQQQMLQTAIQQPNPNGSNPIFLETNTDLSIKTYTNRDIGWMMENKMLGIDGVEQQWPHLMNNKMALASETSIYDSNAPFFQQGYCGGEPLSLFSYTDLAAPGEDVHRNYECQFFFNSDLVSLDKQPQIEPPRGFIDAWSNDNFKTTNEPPVSSSSLGSLSPCSLTLSMAMAADNAMDEELGKIQESDNCVKDMAEIKPKDSTWERHSCWVPFARGGPLAEVLHTGSLATGSNPASPYNNNGDSISTPASTVSSPSGVLHRALFSQSDTSICNSPILPCTRSTN